MKKLSVVLATGLAMLGIAAVGNATILVDNGSSWSYSVLSNDLYGSGGSNWDGAGYNSFDWNNAGWQTGNAAFGNPYSLPYNTVWAAGTDLALQKSFDISGMLSSDVTLNVASDNGFIVFVNGQQVAKQMAEGYTSYWEYTLTLSKSLFNSGSNLIQVLAEDHGGATFFDMNLTGEVSPVPEPTTMLLFGTGIVGLAGMARRKIRA